MPGFWSPTWIFPRGEKRMGIIESTFGSLLRRRGGPQYSRDQLLEQSLKREQNLKGELAQMQLRVSAKTSDLEVKIDLLQFEVSQATSAAGRLQTELDEARNDLEVEKANRSAAVHLLKKHGVVDGVAYSSFTREQRASLIAEAMTEVSGAETTTRWLARAPASSTSAGKKRSPR